MKNNIDKEKKTPNEAAMKVIDAWFDADGKGGNMTDVQGGYTGMSDDCEKPEQDADDL